MYNKKEEKKRRKGGIDKPPDAMTIRNPQPIVSSQCRSMSHKDGAEPERKIASPLFVKKTFHS
jgi:hypothetical protein